MRDVLLQEMLDGWMGMSTRIGTLMTVAVSRDKDLEEAAGHGRSPGR